MTDTKSYKGLTPEEVEASRLRYGRNVLTPPKKKSTFKLLLEKFEDPIVRILLLALLLSFLVSIYQFWQGGESAAVFLEPVGILVAVLLSTGIGFLFERSANKKFDLLNQVGDEVTGKVIRRTGHSDSEGRVMEISRADLVVGDLILVETGDEVPADALLIESLSLQINEQATARNAAVGQESPKYAAGIGMYPIASAGPFMADGVFWTFLAYCGVTGGSLLVIGSAAGITAMGLEQIPFTYYLKKITPWALLSYFVGAGVFLLLI